MSDEDYLAAQRAHEQAMLAAFRVIKGDYKRMKFTLEIELGNEAMQTANDIHSALAKVARALVYGGNPYAPIKLVDGGGIMDVNGNSVGKWEVR